MKRRFSCSLALRMASAAHHRRAAKGTMLRMAAIPNCHEGHIMLAPVMTRTEFQSACWMMRRTTAKGVGGWPTQEPGLGWGHSKLTCKGKP